RAASRRIGTSRDEAATRGGIIGTRIVQEAAGRHRLGVFAASRGAGDRSTLRAAPRRRLHVRLVRLAPRGARSVVRGPSRGAGGGRVPPAADLSRGGDAPARPVGGDVLGGGGGAGEDGPVRRPGEDGSLARRADRTGARRGGGVRAAAGEG